MSQRSSITLARRCPVNEKELAKLLHESMYPNGEWPWETLHETVQREWLVLAKTAKRILAKSVEREVADLRRQLDEARKEVQGE
jgi:hypothetical protein